MKKYYYAKIDGFLPVIEETPVTWYPFMVRRDKDGNETDHEGNKVHRGYVMAQSDVEAFRIVQGKEN